MEKLVPGKDLKRKDSIRDQITAIVENNPQGVIPADLYRRVGESLGTKRRELKGVLSLMVAEGVLEYENRFGSSCIAISFRRPVELVDSIWVTPPDVHASLPPGAVIIRLAKGVSFGDGRHPTTRLALNGLRLAVEDAKALKPGKRLGRLLDVGTGSGILAVAGLKLGMDRAMGIDIDPCARFEARMNAVCNGLEDRFSVTGDGLEDLSGSFSIICANLRLPGIKSMAKNLDALLAPRGWLVVSGILEEEYDFAADFFDGIGFYPRWMKSDAGWAGVLFCRK